MRLFATMMVRPFRREYNLKMVSGGPIWKATLRGYHQEDVSVEASSRCGGPT